MKVIITGKTGLLSQELQKLDPNIVGLDKQRFDITDKTIQDKLKSIDPDIIIHAAAITDARRVETDPVSAIITNIVGTAFIAKYCIEHSKRLIYLSTDYIYPGNIGNYKETDPVLPYNNYAWTKLGGECSTKLVPDHLIIRTSFGSNVFPYAQAWTNQIVSKDYVDIIAPMILNAAKSNMKGILNIGTYPKTMFEYASKRNNVLPTEKSCNNNFSLDTKKYEQFFLH